MESLLVQFLEIAPSLALATVRITLAVIFLPFFTVETLGGRLVKTVVLFWVAVGLLPLIDMHALANAGWAGMLGLMAQEAMVGAVLGVTLAVPAWIAMTMGEMIDNQRGATISASIDPAVGIETSQLGSFMAFYWGAIFLANGGMTDIVELLARSYEAMPVGAGTFQLTLDSVKTISRLLVGALGAGITLAAPCVVAMFLTEIALGLLSKFAPQLNAFSVAMCIKSLIAFSVLILYFSAMVPSKLLAHSGIERAAVWGL